jgi:S1-C subfamily serine protease
MPPKTITIASLFIVAALALSACSGAINAAASQDTAVVEQPGQPAAGQSAPVLQANSGLLAAYEDALNAVYETVNPSVVSIQVVKSAEAAMTQVLPGLPEGLPEGFPNMPGLPNFQQPEDSPEGTPEDAPEGETPEFNPFGMGQGSGFVWDDAGHIVTNNHVVSDSTEIEVIFADGTSAPATLVGADPYSDLAVIKVDVDSSLLQPVKMADSDKVKVGELAIALGNPYGLANTMTVGIVSALGRSIPAGEMAQFTGRPNFTIPEIIQTDAPINPGNSGGVLVNDQGEVLGVTTAIESTSGANAGIGFVVPAKAVLKVVPVLIEKGAYKHPYLGISGGTLTAALAKAMNLPANTRGALVNEVVADGPADKAGLRGSDNQAQINGIDAPIGGDVIIAVNGTEIKGMDDLIAYLVGKTSVGESITITILRNGEPIEVIATLAERP